MTTQTTWSLDDPIQNCNFACQLEIQDDPHHRIKWEIKKKYSCVKQPKHLIGNLADMFLGCCSTKWVFVSIRNQDCFYHMTKVLE